MPLKLHEYHICSFGSQQGVKGLTCPDYIEMMSSLRIQFQNHETWEVVCFIGQHLFLCHKLHEI